MMKSGPAQSIFALDLLESQYFCGFQRRNFRNLGDAESSMPRRTRACHTAGATDIHHPLAFRGAPPQ
ncbi:hypothetical protein [Sphingobium algorifonticola]|uniref:Uncharacterized protein n=1 Tax=Sphingobium algorifonticola TaxID=2008318 RepID=A0A437J4B8_9SPHN|nr:hypothetical protein [Sphingobium algorifonticola]RVT39470.1 hypothetical protein ENE74_15630 [Sphingobium algorifonticola]